MRKILSGLFVIGVVATLGVFVTQAYFSDTEVSTDNTFTTGAIDLKIDSQQHYNNAVCVGGVWVLEAGQTATVTQYPVLGTACTGSWSWTDLKTEKFFNFDDVKPGDMGENTISLHVYNNDAWACMRVDGLTQAGNDITEPEAKTGETVSTGNLGDNLYVMAWKDNGGQNPGDNKYQLGEEVIFAPSKAKDVLNGKNYTYADSTTGTPILGDQAGEKPYYVGMQWCAGMMSVDGQGVITCDGSTMGNDSQTDTLQADVTFDVVQARNNASFVCPGNVVVTTGTGWSPVDLDSNGGGQGKEWFAKARNNNANFEIAIGTNDAAPAGQSTAEAVWVGGKPEVFTLSYDGLGNATLAIVGKTPVSFVVGGVGMLSRIGVNVKAPANQTTTVDDLALSVAPALSDDDVTVTGGTNHLLITGANLNQAWSLTGTFVFSAVGSGTGFGQENPAVQFSID